MSRLPEEFELLIDQNRIRGHVERIAREVDRSYEPDEELVCVGVLKGAWMFHADLVRELKRPVLVDFIRATSYGAGTESSGLVRILKDLEVDVKDRHVLLIEEIIDSGRTLRFLVDRIRSSGPKSVRIAALLDKKERRVVSCEADFLGEEVPNLFLVGYGLDWAEKYRTLPSIYAVRQ